MRNLLTVALIATALSPAISREPNLPLPLREGESREWNNKAAIDKLLKQHEALKANPWITDQHTGKAIYPGVARLGLVGHLIGGLYDFQQITSDSECYVTYSGSQSERLTLKLVGFDTTKNVDGDRLPTVSVTITGTETYTTVTGGSNKVFVATVNKNLPKKEIQVPDLPYRRTWTNKVHKSTIRASFYGHDKGLITIITSDLRNIEVPLEILSDEDKAHVKTLLSQKRMVDSYVKKADRQSRASMSWDELGWDTGLDMDTVEEPYGMDIESAMRNR